jgi:hypothetical protein
MVHPRDYSTNHTRTIPDANQKMTQNYNLEQGFAPAFASALSKNRKKLQFFSFPKKG